MNLVVDTSVWLLALRRRSGSEDLAAARLRELIEAGHGILVPGVVLQELLQSIRSSGDFERVLTALRAFTILHLEPDDYVEAARLFNKCKSKGVQAGTIDAQLAAACARRDIPLFTCDRDFQHIAPHCGLKLL